MKYLTYLGIAIFLVIGYISCDFPLMDIFIDEDIVKETPIDTSNNSTDTIPVDTITTPPIDSSGLQGDSCTDYADLVNTPFSTWVINLDGIIPGTYTFVYKPYGIEYPINDINTFIDSITNLPAGSTKTYYSGINVCQIVSGLSNPSHMLNTSIYLENSFGIKTVLTFSPYNFVFNGTLTFEQFFNELVLHSNFKRLGFWNTAFTCDEYLQILDYIIDNCIDGTGNIIDLRSIPLTCPIDAERIAKLELADFTVVPQS